MEHKIGGPSSSSFSPPPRGPTWLNTAPWILNYCESEMWKVTSVPQEEANKVLSVAACCLAWYNVKWTLIPLPGGGDGDDMWPHAVQKITGDVPQAAGYSSNCRPFCRNPPPVEGLAGIVMFYSGGQTLFNLAHFYRFRRKTSRPQTHLTCRSAGSRADKSFCIIFNDGCDDSD